MEELIEVVKQGIIKELKDELREHNPREIHISDITSCLRKSWYKFVEGEDDIRYSSAYVMLHGTKFHEIIQKILIEKYGGEAEKELVIDYGYYKVVGHCDYCNDKFAVEIKTTSAIPYMPYKNHIMQLNMYLGMLKLKKGYILYVQREDGEMKTFAVEFNEELFRECIERAKTLFRCLKKNMPPPAEASPLCKFCPYADKCRAEFEKTLF